MLAVEKRVNLWQGEVQVLDSSVNGDFRSVGSDYSVGDGDMLCTFTKV